MKKFERNLRVSAGFWVLVLWFAAVNGLRTLGVVLAAAFLHEAGHWLALKALGGRVLGLRIGILGAVMEADCSRLSYGRELAVVLAGPTANLVCAWLLTAFAGGMEAAVGAHLVLGAFNLLPVRPLDGGCGLYLLCAWLLGPDRGDRIVRVTGILTAAALAAGLCWLMGCTGGSLWLLPAAGGLLAAAWRECSGN